jgi:hypothetical protein
MCIGQTLMKIKFAHTQIKIIIWRTAFCRKENDRWLGHVKWGRYGTSVAQSTEQAPFTSEIVGSILATDSREKSQSTLFRKSWVLSGRSGFLRQGKLVGWVRIKDMNTVMKVISQLLKRYYNILRYNYSFVSYILDKRDLYLYWRTKIV